MKINGMAKVDKTPVDEIVKSKELGHVSFDASFYPEKYKDLLFALKPRRSKEQIKEQFISEIAKLKNIAPGVLETVEKIDPENLVSLNYFEIFDLSLKNVYRTVNTTHKVYDTVGVEVKTTVSSSGEISSTATPMKEYSHSYTTSKDEILYKKYNGDFSSIESHSFLKKGIMYSLPSKVDVKDLLLFDDIKEFDIIRIDQEGYRSVNVGSSYSLERIKSTHEMHIKNVVNHKLTSATYIENITLNKIVLHPIWKVEFDFTVNGDGSVSGAVDMGAAAISFPAACTANVSFADGMKVGTYPLIKGGEIASETSWTLNLVNGGSRKAVISQNGGTVVLEVKSLGTVVTVR